MEKHGKKLNMTLQQRLQECLAAQLVGDRGKYNSFPEILVIPMYISTTNENLGFCLKLERSRRLIS